MMQRLIWVLWPAFFIAIPAVGLVFTLFDPEDMHLFGENMDLGRMGAYTLGFLFFWGLGACSSGLTCLLQRSPYEVNRCPIPKDDRPVGCPKRTETGQGC
ncbi:MAG: hypothetical protein NT115_18595 [Proteobacteria bacterium]|nr:hypothetical protein [Pseudomonadota bacterium]